MRFAVSDDSAKFWAHFGHLGIRHEDPSGVPWRALVPESCEPCKRLWEKLEPMGNGSPAVLGRLWTAAGEAVFVRADTETAAKARSAERPLCDREPDSVRVVRHFTAPSLRGARRTLA